MANNIFADTNILIQLLSGNIKIKPFLKDAVIHISFITEMELKSKLFITKKEIAIIDALLESCVLYELNQPIKQNATILMRNNRLKLPDAIIAATADYYNIPLITGDTKFEGIANCTVIKFQ